MSAQLKRREFITLLGGAAATWPLAAGGQQPAMPLIGFLSSVSASVTSKISSLGQGLSDTGYTVGRDVTVEARMAEGQDDRLPALAADLVSGHVRLIAASGPPAAFAAKRAATSIPIVFVAAFDPVQAGLVATLNQPGGNVTGVTLIGARLGGQPLELARELVPNVGVIAVITNPNSTDASEELRAKRRKRDTAGTRCGRRHERSRFRSGLAVIVQRRAQVLLIGTDPFLAQSVDHCPGCAASHSRCLCDQRIRRRLDHLRTQHLGRLAPCGCVCRDNPQRDDARGFAGRATD